MGHLSSWLCCQTPCSCTALLASCPWHEGQQESASTAWCAPGHVLLDGGAPIWGSSTHRISSGSSLLLLPCRKVGRAPAIAGANRGGHVWGQEGMRPVMLGRSQVVEECQRIWSGITGHGGCPIPGRWERQGPVALCSESCASSAKLEGTGGCSSTAGLCGCVLAGDFAHVCVLGELLGQATTAPSSVCSSAWVGRDTPCSSVLGPQEPLGLP